MTDSKFQYYVWVWCAWIHDALFLQAAHKPGQQAWGCIVFKPGPPSLITPCPWVKEQQLRRKYETHLASCLACLRFLRLLYLGIPEYRPLVSSCQSTRLFQSCSRMKAPTMSSKHLAAFMVAHWSLPSESIYSWASGQAHLCQWDLISLQLLRSPPHKRYKQRGIKPQVLLQSPHPCCCILARIQPHFRHWLNPDD